MLTTKMGQFHMETVGQLNLECRFQAFALECLYEGPRGVNAEHRFKLVRRRVNGGQIAWT